VGNRRECLNSNTFSLAHGTPVLIYFHFQTPQDRERVATFAGADESTPLHRLDGNCDWPTEGVFLHCLSNGAELGCRRANQFEAGSRPGCAKEGLVQSLSVSAGD
jgi:hypothetical protein